MLGKMMIKDNKNQASANIFTTTVMKMEFVRRKKKVRTSTKCYQNISSSNTEKHFLPCFYPHSFSVAILTA